MGAMERCRCDLCKGRWRMYRVQQCHVNNACITCAMDHGNHSESMKQDLALMQSRVIAGQFP